MKLLNKIIILTIIFCSPAVFANNERLTLPGNDLKLNFDADPAWQEPVYYSARVMSMGLAGLVAFDLHHSDPSIENLKSVLEDPAPRADEDGAIFNLVLHPLWGSETYLRARRADMGILGSFAFSMGASTVWEYFVESWTEHPSQQDLIYTTGIGWMIGEVRHQALNSLSERHGRWVDPLYYALNKFRFNVEYSEGGYYEADAPMLSVSWDI